MHYMHSTTSDVLRDLPQQDQRDHSLLALLTLLTSR